MRASSKTERPSRPPGKAPTERPARYRVARWVGLGIVIALVVVIAAVLVRGADDDAAPGTGGGDVVVPDGLTSDGWIALGDGPVTVAVYFDYLCPACGAFEAANGDELDRLLEAGDITLELRPISFLDDLSAGTEYSTRSANAVATVVDAEPDLVWAFHRALYASQPAEGAEGLTDAQLATLANGTGVPDEVTSRFAEGSFEAWTAERTERAFADGIEGTPTILVDGNVFEGDPYSTGPLTDAIEQAGG